MSRLAPGDDRGHREPAAAGPGFPRLLRPPDSNRSSAEFKRWYDGIVPAPAVVDPADPGYNPLGQEFNDWQEAHHSLWSRIRDLWKEFDRWRLSAPGAAGAAGVR